MTGEVQVVWLESRVLCWDQSMVDAALTGALGVNRYSYAHVVGWGRCDTSCGAVVVVPARYYSDHTDVLQNRLQALPWVLLILTSDEESLFDPYAVSHDRMCTWVMTPRARPEPGRYLGEGWPAYFPAEMAAQNGPPTRDLGWFFAGQITHTRRTEMVAALHQAGNGYLLETESFTAGFPPGQYAQMMTRAKVVPCPSGPATVDSFRLFEALEAGCIPVADARTPARHDPDYWWDVLGDPTIGRRGEVPFPQIEEWHEFPQVLKGLLAGWPANANRVWSWWLRYKRDLVVRLEDDICWLTSDAGIEPRVSVIVTTSPIESHPSTAIIEETVASIRYHHPDAEIVLACDGVRPEQEHLRSPYEQYLHRVMWLAQNRWRNVYPLISDEHVHQANMTRLALDVVRTQMVLFVEHDTPLVTDERIDWPACYDVIARNRLDVVRFHHEAHVHPEHVHLSLPDDEQTLDGFHLTTQWSQRPHLANTGYYRRLLREHFPESSRTMVEDLAHSLCQCEPDEHRIGIYHPDGGNIKRSLHSDGRGGAEKFDMDFGTREVAP